MLELYALQRLSDPEAEAIEEHLLLCPSCVRRLEGIGAFAVAMREGLKSGPASAETGNLRRFRWLQPRFAIPLALAVAVLGLAIYSGINRGSRLAPVATFELSSVRGTIPTVGAAREIDLTLTDVPQASGPFRVDVVADGGTRVWSGSPKRVARGVEVRVNTRIPPGNYFVRLFSAAGQLLHEYGFHLVPA
jgi:hypothetical protein